MNDLDKIQILERIYAKYPESKWGVNNSSVYLENCASLNLSTIYSIGIYKDDKTDAFVFYILENSSLFPFCPSYRFKGSIEEVLEDLDTWLNRQWVNKQTIKNQ